MFSKSRLHSQSGSIVLGALAVATLIGIFAGAIATQIRSSDEMTQLPRVRAAMAQIEVQVRLAAFSATSYACSYDAASTSNYTCSVRNDVFTNMRAVVDQGEVSVTTPTWDPVTTRFATQVQFKLADTATKRFQMAPRLIDLEIPSEILQPTSFSCPAARPIFQGYYAVTDATHRKGEANCQPLTTGSCPIGSYISSINPTTLEPVCSQAGTSVSCPAQQYISNFSWNGGGSVTYGCTNRKDPFTEMGWNYLTALNVDTTYMSADPDIPDVTPPPLPSPDVVTWSAPASQPANGCYTPPAINCVGAFSGCSVTCGGGTQTYIVSQVAQNGGAACPYTNNFTMPCNQQACTVPTPGPTPVPPTGLGRCTCMEGASDGACDSGTLLNAVNYENVTSCASYGSNGGGSGAYCNCSFATYSAAVPTPVPTPVPSGDPCATPGVCTWHWLVKEDQGCASGSLCSGITGQPCSIQQNRFFCCDATRNEFRCQP